MRARGSDFGLEDNVSIVLNNKKLRTIPSFL